MTTIRIVHASGEVYSEYVVDNYDMHEFYFNNYIYSLILNHKKSDEVLLTIIMNNYSIIEEISILKDEENHVNNFYCRNCRLASHASIIAHYEETCTTKIKDNKIFINGRDDTFLHIVDKTCSKCSNEMDICEECTYKFNCIECPNDIVDLELSTDDDVREMIYCDRHDTDSYGYSYSSTTYINIVLIKDNNLLLLIKKKVISISIFVIILDHVLLHYVQLAQDDSTDYDDIQVAIEESNTNKLFDTFFLTKEEKRTFAYMLYNKFKNISDLKEFYDTLEDDFETWQHTIYKEELKILFNLF